MPCGHWGAGGPNLRPNAGIELPLWVRRALSHPCGTGRHQHNFGRPAQLWPKPVHAPTNPCRFGRTQTNWAAKCEPRPSPVECEPRLGPRPALVGPRAPQVRPNSPATLGVSTPAHRPRVGRRPALRLHPKDALYFDIARRRRPDLAVAALLGVGPRRASGRVPVWVAPLAGRAPTWNSWRQSFAQQHMVCVGATQSPSFRIGVAPPGL